MVESFTLVVWFKKLITFINVFMHTHVIIWILIKILALVLPLIVAVAYLTLVERKIIAAMQLRIGPNRVGPYGLLQPLVDVAKLLIKEIILPTKANQYLYIIAPILAIAPTLVAWSVIPFMPNMVLADLNLGLLFLLTMTALSVYGIIIAGWSSNSKYAFLGAIRSSAQVIAYEIPMSFAVLGVVMCAGSLNLSTVVMAQDGGFWHWYWLPLFPLMIIYWICAVAETNRAPFDIAEGESEIVAGFHVEYAGITFALFFLAEYMNMILVSTLAAIMFFGGWLSPFQGIPFLGAWFAFVPGIFWLLAKVSGFLFLFIWFRATFPRYRYDKVMRLGWKVFIPVTLFWLVVVAIAIKLNIGGCGDLHA